MKFNKEEIEIIKDSFKQYDYLEQQLTYQIKDGSSMEQLLDYVESNFDANITNCELNDEFKYIDINYGNLTCSIISSNKIPPTLSKYVSIWNDKINDILVEIEDINNLKNIIKELE